LQVKNEICASYITKKKNWQIHSYSQIHIEHLKLSVLLINLCIWKIQDAPATLETSFEGYLATSLIIAGVRFGVIPHSGGVCFKGVWTSKNNIKMSDLIIQVLSVSCKASDFSFKNMYI